MCDYSYRYVGRGYPGADRRGYMMTHRWMAEQKLGRSLRPGEYVHHIDGNRENNEPENLEIVVGQLAHMVHHRKRDDLRMPGEENPVIECECGCGETMERYDGQGRPRRFKRGHNRRGLQ